MRSLAQRLAFRRFYSKSTSCNIISWLSFTIHGACSGWRVGIVPGSWLDEEKSAFIRSKESDATSRPNLHKKQIMDGLRLRSDQAHNDCITDLEVTAVV